MQHSRQDAGRDRKPIRHLILVSSSYEAVPRCCHCRQRKAAQRKICRNRDPPCTDERGDGRPVAAACRLLPRQQRNNHPAAAVQHWRLSKRVKTGVVPHECSGSRSKLLIIGATGQCTHRQCSVTVTGWAQKHWLAPPERLSHCCRQLRYDGESIRTAQPNSGVAAGSTFAAGALTDFVLMSSRY
jgi:hypothetical protein